MNTIKDERDYGYEDICDNCKRKRLGRPVEVFGWRSSRESRGFHFFCFDCFGPHFVWQAPGKYGKSITSPLLEIR